MLTIFGPILGRFWAYVGAFEKMLGIFL